MQVVSGILEIREKATEITKREIGNWELQQEGAKRPKRTPNQWRKFIKYKNEKTEFTGTKA
jgi:hypothetical protein